MLTVTMEYTHDRNVAIEATYALIGGIKDIYTLLLEQEQGIMTMPSAGEYTNAFFIFIDCSFDPPHTMLELFVYSTDLWVQSCSFLNLVDYIKCVKLYIHHVRCRYFSTAMVDSAHANIMKYTEREKECLEYDVFLRQELSTCKIHNTQYDDIYITCMSHMDASDMQWYLNQPTNDIQSSLDFTDKKDHTVDLLTEL